MRLSGVLGLVALSSTLVWNQQVTAAPPQPDPFQENEQAMENAIQQQNLAQVKTLTTSKYYQPNVTWSRSIGYIYLDIRRVCNVPILNELLATGASANPPDVKNEPVLYASMDLCPSSLQPLLAAGASTHVTFYWGVVKGLPITAYYAFAEGVGQGPICSAAFVPQIKALMAAGADANAAFAYAGSVKESVLWGYLWQGQSCPDQLAVLLDKQYSGRADVSWPMPHGTRPIDYASQCAAPARRQATVAVLLAAGSTPARPSPVNCNNPQSW